MRLSELSFARVGLWRELPLRLGARVTLVLGDNEAGKSTAMRAVEMLLFGNAGGQARALVAPLPSESLFAAAATARLADGAEVRLERKGRALVSPPEGSVPALLDESHASRFRDLFRIDHAHVRADGGFLAEDGALGRVLFAAASGASAAELSRLEATLRDRVERARSGRKDSDGLKVRLEAYREAKSEAAAKPQFGAYDAEADEVTRLGVAIGEATREIAALDGEAQRLAALAAGRVDDDALEVQRRALEALAAEGPLPAHDWPGRSKAAFGRVAEAEGELAEAREVERRAAEALDGAPAPAALVAFEAEIGEADRDVAALAAEQAELAKRQRALDEARAKLVELVAALGARGEEGALVATAESLLLAPPRRKALAEALEREASLATDEEQAKRRLDDARRAFERARTLALEVPPASTAELEAALRIVDRLEALAARLDEKRGVEREQRARGRGVAVKLGLSALADRALASVPVPGRDAVERAWSRRQQAVAALSAVTVERTNVEGRLAEASRELERLAAGLSAPAREALDGAREAREQAFGALEALWTPALHPEAERELPRLASAYGARVTEADAVADRRFDDAERLGRVEAARTARRALERELGLAADGLRRVEEEWSAAEQALGALFPFLAAPPSDPAAWLHEHRTMLDALEAADAAGDEARQVEVERGRLLRELRAVAGGEVPSLAALETEATLRSELGRALGERRARNEEAANRAADERTAASALPGAEQALARATEALAGFRAHWSELVAEVPASVGREPVAVREWVERQEALRATTSDVRALEGEVSARRAALVAREERVRELFARVRGADPSVSALEGLGAHDLARELGARARKAVEQRHAHEAAATARDGAATQRRRAEAAVAARREELSALWREAGLAGEPDVTERERAAARAAAAHEWRTTLARLEAVLATHWPMGVEAARGEIAGRSADELVTARAEKVALRGALAERRDALIGERARVEARLAALGVAPDETDAAQRWAMARAAVLERADEVVHLELAAWLLAKARERAADGARPIVERASRLFAELTEGAYEGLELDRDGDEPALLALPAGGRPKHGAELSDGTCDAIWLALRLAVAEAAARETPFPLLLDDVFVHLDDRRTTAALRVLAELSERVQVIVFTHHDHVVDLARQAIDDVLTVAPLATPVAGEHVRLLPEVRVRHERPPAPVAAPSEPEGAGATSRDAALGAVIEVLRAGRVPMDKGEIVEAARAAGVDIERVWGIVVARLKEEGRIVQTGNKRGARYALAGGEGEPS